MAEREMPKQQFPDLRETGLPEIERILNPTVEQFVRETKDAQTKVHTNKMSAFDFLHQEREEHLRKVVENGARWEQEGNKGLIKHHDNMQLFLRDIASAINHDAVLNPSQRTYVKVAASQAVSFNDESGAALAHSPIGLALAHYINSCR